MPSNADSSFPFYLDDYRYDVTIFRDCIYVYISLLPWFSPNHATYLNFSIENDSR